MRAVLADVRSSHNTGSIFRTADATGIEKIYLCGITPGPSDRYHRPNKKLLKVSLGAEKTVAWERASSASRLLDRLKKDGWEIWALEQSPESKSLFTVRPKNFEKTVLVVGNEITGLSRAILKRAHTIAEIPMFGQKESLNVSVAFGIAAYQFRQRRS